MKINYSHTIPFNVYLHVPLHQRAKDNEIDSADPSFPEEKYLA